MKTGLILLLLLILTITSCNTGKPFNCKCDTSDLVYNDSIVDGFLKDKVFFKRQDKFYRLPRLQSLNTESYRLKMQHSFSKYEQFYTLKETENGAELDVREYCDKTVEHCKTKIFQGREYQYDCKYDIQYILVKRYQQVLSKKQWNDIKTEIIEGCYWSNKAGTGIRHGLDGGSWIMEGYDPESNNCAKREHNIDACSTESGNKLGDLCRTIRKYAHEERLHLYKD